MRLTKYKTELDDNFHNILVKESSWNYPVENICNPEEVFYLFTDVFNLNKLAEEYVYMLALNTKGKVLGVFEISHGTVDYSLCNPRDIFIKALLCGATSFILIHNHPSGDCFPSETDFEMYKNVSSLCRMIGIKIMDNIIVGRNKFFSFKKENVA